MKYKFQVLLVVILASLLVLTFPFQVKALENQASLFVPREGETSPPSVFISPDKVDKNCKLPGMDGQMIEIPLQLQERFTFQRGDDARLVTVPNDKASLQYIFYDEKYKSKSTFSQLSVAGYVIIDNLIIVDSSDQAPPLTFEIGVGLIYKDREDGDKPKLSAFLPYDGKHNSQIYSTGSCPDSFIISPWSQYQLFLELMSGKKKNSGFDPKSIPSNGVHTPGDSDQLLALPGSDPPNEEPSKCGDIPSGFTGIFRWVFCASVDFLYSVTCSILGGCEPL